MEESKEKDTRIEGPGTDPFTVLEVAVPIFVGGGVGSILGAIAVGLGAMERAASTPILSNALFGLHLLYILVVIVFIGQAFLSSRRRGRIRSSTAHLSTLTLFLTLWAWSRWGMN